MISTGLKQRAICILLIGCGGAETIGQVEMAVDGPRARTPEESLGLFQVPEGFRVELVASEPLISQPSGVCWDEMGRLHVSELHGYNLEGQYDIEELNKTGQLDRVVRRIQANEEARRQAEAGTYGVIKRLHDRDGDGRMDEAAVFADELPPCYGMVPARGGLIVAAAPHIYYLADRDGDGRADVRETLFSGFSEGVLERRISSPQWGLDNWIYIAGGGRADQITGPNLDGPVSLGRTDFRIRADGSAIEPVEGQTGTFGHTFTAEGDRITISTGTPGYQVIPLPWRYLLRNPNLSIPSMQRNAANYQETWPISAPHPWRTRRFEDPGFSKYYTDRYGLTESKPNGYFTSACSPFIYRDTAFPEYYAGANFTCEPAQNLIHLSIPDWDGTVLHLRRGNASVSEQRVNQWIQARTSLQKPPLPEVSNWMSLGPVAGSDKNALFDMELAPESGFQPDTVVESHTWIERPDYADGGVVDPGMPENSVVFLHRILTSREEVTIHVSLGSNDAIKCWLNGSLILSRNVNRSAAPDQEVVALHLRKGRNSFLMKIVNGTNTGGFYFRLQPGDVPPAIQEILDTPRSQWSESQFGIVEKYVQSRELAESGTEFLASKDTWFHPINLCSGPDGAIYICDYYREIIEDYSAIPRYLQQQYGLTNGMNHGRIWRLTHNDAREPSPFDMSQLSGNQLAEEIGSSNAWRRTTSRRLLVEKRNYVPSDQLEAHLSIHSPVDAAINALHTLHGLNLLTPENIRLALNHPAWAVRRQALRTGDMPNAMAEVKSAVGEWLGEPAGYGNEARLLIQTALSLGEFNTPGAMESLTHLAMNHKDIPWMDTAIVSSASGREEALLQRLISSGEDADSRIIRVLVETLAAGGDAVRVAQASAALRQGPADRLPLLQQYIKTMAEGLAKRQNTEERVVIDPPALPDEESLEKVEAVFPEYIEALNTTEHSNPQRGKNLFSAYCAVCHKSGGIGVNAGPDLNSEFQRAPETILRDILFPNESISEGYRTVRLEMHTGADAVGLPASETPTGITLRFPGGNERTFLRKNIRNIHTHAVSLMPSHFSSVLRPDEAADIIRFLRRAGEARRE